MARFIQPLPTLFYLLIVLCVLASCRKSDNTRIPELERINVPLITMGPASGRTIPVSDPNAFSTTVVVDLYFKDGDKPKQLDLVVMKNSDKSSVKVLQGGITTFPTNVTVTGQQLEELFGAEIILNDTFSIGANLVTRNDQVYQAFPKIGIPYGQSIANLPGASTGVQFVCADFCFYDPSAFTGGDYEVIEDEWGDFAASDVVTITKIDDTHFSFEFATDNPVPVVIAVDPVTNDATVASVMYGSYDFGPPTGAVNFTTKSVAGTKVNACDTSFHLMLNHVAEGYGDQGDYLLELKKL